MEEEATSDQNVILVPPGLRRAFLAQGHADAIRLQAADCDEWVVPTPRDTQLLLRFVAHAEGTSDRSLQVLPGTRVGHDGIGVYIHEDHHKRYFGVVRDGASMELKLAVPEAAPRTSVGEPEGRTGQHFLGSLMQALPAVSDTARENLLRATFRSVDTNRNGVICKRELVALLRKVMPTMSGLDVVRLWEGIDVNNDDQADYEEFITWISKNAPPKVASAFERALRTESDCVHAVFRVWDKNGNGVITKRELATVLRKTCPQLTMAEIKALMLHMDQNRDDMVDYDEFVRFLFNPVRPTSA